MIEKELFPAYTPRIVQEKQVKKFAHLVREDRQSRVILLYGVGGTGKTYFVRNLPKELDIPDIKWVGPIDLDDSEFWSLFHLKITLARTLGKDYFTEYFAHLSKYKNLSSEDEYLNYQRQENRIFISSYKNYIEKNKEIPFIILDTVEAIRGMDVIVALIDWIKQLPGTLFLLSGRPPLDKDRVDEVVDTLELSPEMPYEVINLEEFTYEESLKYLSESRVITGLNPEMKEAEKLVLLSKGHPLWLALTIHFLEREGLPKEVEEFSLNELRALSQNNPIFDEYIRELLVPYRDREFWHEAILRLAVLRQRINKDIWVEIMKDIKLPDEATGWNDAWDKFLAIPWIRSRANNQYITLHDALAEELARRYLPKSDKDGTWRHALWVDAAKIYKNQVSTKQQSLNEGQKPRKKGWTGGLNLLEASYAIDPEYQYLDIYLLQIVHLHYEMLVNSQSGVNLFIDLAKQALGERRRFLVDLLSLEIQRFLPGQSIGVLNDVERHRLNEVQKWFENNPENLFSTLFLIAELNLFLGRYKDIKNYLQQSLDHWKKDNRYDLYIDGSIWLFTSTWRQNLEEGLYYLEQALTVVGYNQATEEKLPQIQYLMGFAYRTNQQLDNARTWLEKATKSSRKYHQPGILASALNLLGYIYATVGDVEKASPTVRQALELRQHLADQISENSLKHREMKIDVGWSYNTLGEINRYKGKLAAAQTFYLKAERIFRKEQYYEGQAIALHALSDTRRRIALAADRRGDDEQSTRYWKASEESILESLGLYERYDLDRGRETALRRYGRFLHARGRFDEAGNAFQKGLDEAKRKKEILEIVENTQELAFLAAEQGDQTKFRYWVNEMDPYKGKIEQWNAFPPLMKIAEGTLFFTQKKYDKSLAAYKVGYPQLIKNEGYGSALYETHRDRVFSNIAKLPNLSEKQKWLQDLKKVWEVEGLVNKHSDFIELCDLQLLTIEFFSGE